MPDHSRPRRVTIVDIASALGVTPATVSNAFNRPDQLSAGLRERILATAAEMGYLGPDAAARSLRGPRLRTIGVLYADQLTNAFTDPAFVLFLQGLAGALEQAGLAMTLIPGWPRRERGPAAIRSAVVDGFVVYSMADDDPLVSAAVDRRLPLVVVDSPRLPGVPAISIDDVAAARAAARHLLDLGHRRFGIIAGELHLDRRQAPLAPHEVADATYAVNRARLHGYLGELDAAGVPAEQILIEEAGGVPEQAAAAAAHRLIERDPATTALLAMSDRLARGALDALGALGKRVPEGVSVIGFDDDPLAERTVPPLTTVRQPHAAKGRLAGELVVSLLNGAKPTAPRLLETKLVIRHSTAPPPDVNT